jgi:hypothetical protein
MFYLESPLWIDDNDVNDRDAGGIEESDFIYPFSYPLLHLSPLLPNQDRNQLHPTCYFTHSCLYYYWIIARREVNNLSGPNS